MSEHFIINKELSHEEQIKLQRMIESFPLTEILHLPEYRGQLIEWMWSGCINWPEYFINISRKGDYLKSIEINNFDLGEHIFKIREDKYNLKQYEIFYYPLMLAIYSNHSIIYKPYQMPMKNIKYREVYNIFKPIVKKEFEKSLNYDGKFYDWKHDIVKIFKNECLNFYCVGVPNNYKFLEYNYNNPPIFHKPLLIPLIPNQNIGKWEKDNKEQLLNEINFYNNFTNLEKNEPVYSTMCDIVLSADENDIGLKLQIQPACGPNCPLCMRMMLHYETEVIIKDKHIKNRKSINSNTFTYREILKKWQNYCDKTIENSTEEYLISKIPNQNNFTIPAETILPDYTMKYEYFFDLNDRRKFLKEKYGTKWRDTIII